jgi:hypothetical protein
VYPALLSVLFAEANVLSYLAAAKPLVTSTHEATGYCLHPSSDAHLLVKPCMPAAAANPNWRFDASSSQILLKGSSNPAMCLSGSEAEGVRVVGCMVGAQEQQWQLTASRQLRSVTGVCMGLGAMEEVAAVQCGSASEAVWSFGGKHGRISVYTCRMRAVIEMCNTGHDCMQPALHSTPV